MGWFSSCYAGFGQCCLQAVYVQHNRLKAADSAAQESRLPPDQAFPSGCRGPGRHLTGSSRDSSRLCADAPTLRGATANRQGGPAPAGISLAKAGTPVGYVRMRPRCAARLRIGRVARRSCGCRRCLKTRYAIPLIIAANNKPIPVPNNIVKPPFKEQRTKNKELRTESKELRTKDKELRNCLKSVGHGATAPARESRLQPVPATPRLKPGLLGRCPVYQCKQHAV